jgi:hypothetical protein
VGSGWGACSFIKALPPAVAASIDLTVVSPRNYFLYTPLLPAVATGTVEERSIVEPVRKVLGGKGAYFEAVCHEIDPVAKSIVCCFPADAGLDQACFKVPYDILIVAVGCVNNTFGVSGVAEHAFFFKSIEDAARLRRHVSECFERAALPQTPPEEKERLLSFVVCGGGPTGVEVAAELHDMITEDLAKVREREGRVESEGGGAFETPRRRGEGAGSSFRCTPPLPTPSSPPHLFSHRSTRTLRRTPGSASSSCPTTCCPRTTARSPSKRTPSSRGRASRRCSTRG